MIGNRKWFAFFSHTGSEILNLSKELGTVPDRVITNKSPDDDDINKELIKSINEVHYTTSRPTVSDYDRLLLNCKDCVCTLHGWMRIIPKSICTEYDMYNLHPGLITKYPELRGKDPQSRVDESYGDIGLVVHKVTEGVDEGEILIESSCSNKYYNEKQVTERLHGMALDAWVDFFKYYIVEDQEEKCVDGDS
jgi:folate-dependent phosphoribosylglycinamide formyltransferase PurN